MLWSGVARVKDRRPPDDDASVATLHAEIASLKRRAEAAEEQAQALRQREDRYRRLAAMATDTAAEAGRLVHASHRLLEELGSSLPALFWIRDFHSGALVYASPTWERLLGRAPVLGEHAGQLFAAILPEHRARLLEHVQQGRTFDEVVPFVAAGVQRWYHMRAFPVCDETGAPYRMAGFGYDVTQVRETLEALRHSEAKYRNLFEDAPVAIYRCRLDGSGILDMNRRFCELLGYPREALVDETRQLQWASPNARTEMMRRLASRGSFDDIELSVATRTGQREVLASAIAYPSQGYFEGSLVDVTAHRQAEAALAEARTQLARVFETTSDLLVLSEVRGDRLVVVAMNDACRAFCRAAFGTDPVGLVGCERSELLRELGAPEPAIEAELPMYARALETRRPQRYELAVPAGALATHLDVRIEPVLSPAGVVTHLLYTARDITARKLAEEAMAASLREKEALLQEIHHRVKNNLQIVSSLLYLQSIKAGGPQLEALRESRDRVTAMALVHEKLYQSPDTAAVPFSRYVEDLASSLYASRGEDPSRIRLVVVPTELTLDIEIAVPCGLILHEVLSNAMKHAFPDGRTGSIHVELAAGEDGYELILADDGRGLPPGFSPESSGSLGMKLVDRLVAQIDGRLERTTGERGTRYRISIPLPRPRRHS